MMVPTLPSTFAPGLKVAIEYHASRARELLDAAHEVLNRAAKASRTGDARAVAELIDEAAVHRASAAAFRRILKKGVVS